MRLKFEDTEFEVLGEDDLMWAEAAAVERVTGMTMVEIGAKGQVCGCSHRLSIHVPDEDPVCKDCGCDQPARNVPAEVAQAMLWVSMKRARPELSFKDVGGMAMAALTRVEGVEPDPTQGEETSSTTASSSPKSSESDPGNGTDSPT